MTALQTENTLHIKLLKKGTVRLISNNGDVILESTLTEQIQFIPIKNVPKKRFRSTKKSSRKSSKSKSKNKRDTISKDSEL